MHWLTGTHARRYHKHYGLVGTGHLYQDVAATAEHAEKLGAEVLMAPVSDSAGFTFARLQDTAGNHFGVFSAPAP